MKRIVLLGAILASLVGGFHEWSPAYGSVSHIFGWGGKQYTFDAKCHRITFLPPGTTTKEAVNVVGQQVYCLVRRPDPFARCVKRLGPAPTVELVRKDDWTNVDKVAAYQAAIYECSKARL